MPKLDIEAKLNKEQLRAVKTIDGPVLIIAGAGSGKTRVITYRIAHMLDQGIPQSAILALTFTNKAAREMEERVKELTGKKLQNLTVSTFHAFGVRILRDEIERLGYRKNFSIYDETDRTQAIKESLRECRISTEGTDLYAVGQLFSNIKTGRFKWGDASGGITGNLANDAWEPVYKDYQHSLKVYNALDFDDLLALPIQLFEQFPEALEKYRSRYRYIMVDEFQDTSFIQYRIMHLLADRNVCVVGDDDQSIYSWRGASYENILTFEKDFPGVTEIKLEQNYRSTSTILEAANGVISNNTNRKEKQLWSGNKGGKPVELFYPQNESEEADFIATRIRDLMMRDRLKYDDFGVLLRTNSMTRSIEEAFLAENIPYRVSGGTSFFQRKEIKDVLSYLRVIANTNDDVNLLRIINTPRRGIGKTTITMLNDLARKNHSNIWDSMGRIRYTPDVLFQEAAKGKVELDEFMQLIETYKEELLGKRGISQKVRALVDSIDYWSYLVTEYSKNEKVAKWKFLNIESLIQSMETWEKDPDNFDPSLYAYLNRVSLITRDDGDDEAGKGKVNLMTIHASKGLEFPVVFIAGAEDGIIPHERAMEDGEGNSEFSPLEEERRLFYVAITRARDKLFITSCLHRRRLQSSTDCVPSPFLAEIPPHLVEYHEPDKPVETPEEAESYFSLIKSKFI
ncbi:helicase, UvrD/Rep family [Treponema primitia ZAS-2]|uniref:DNA 3'-5' helicase n=1 Tax=Treponema primitia (strain ATCC BAA-887 / DSM 12427 / ZAS-2) TaxID=545694 RepID=F5YNS6_TREPZ|nr:UvrD-helicase domain-containing protein [Treponema primitia]AEF86777.1 helicase, UvrD/Rep family [Treponema primitia ZAS-2]